METYAITVYVITEEVLRILNTQDEGIRLMAKRGSRAKNRVRSPAEEKQISSRRQIVETAFSSVLQQFSRCIKSRTENGFILKVFCFILSYSVSFLWQGSLT